MCETTEVEVLGDLYLGKGGGVMSVGGGSMLEGRGTTRGSRRGQEGGAK